MVTKTNTASGNLTTGDQKPSAGTQLPKAKLSDVQGVGHTRAPTPAHIRVLRRAAENEFGQERFYGTRGLAYGAWDRMLNRMCRFGWMAPTAHGDFEITASGRTALAKATGGQS